MPYNCQEIKKLLDSDIEIGIDLSDFDKHLASCEKCRALVAIEPVIADSLRSALPSPAPANNYANIMESIRLQEAGIKSISQIARYLVPILTGAISMVLVIFNRPLFNNAINYLNLDFGKIWEHFNLTEQVKASVIAEALKVSASPLLLIAFLGMAFLIWYHSISGIEKVSK